VSSRIRRRDVPLAAERTRSGVQLTEVRTQHDVERATPRAAQTPLRVRGPNSATAALACSSPIDPTSPITRRETNLRSAQRRDYSAAFRAASRSISACTAALDCPENSSW
jgi:hypothetical protein